MTYLIKIISLANGASTQAAGQFILSFDPNANHGRGALEFTSDPRLAKPFPDQRAAFTFWKTESTVKPVREDGQPNRPLTAYNCLFEPLVDVIPAAGQA